MFLPDWAERFDLSHVEWLDQEVFPDPPEGILRRLDLLAKLDTRESVDDKWLALLHIEVDSAETAVPRRRQSLLDVVNLLQTQDLPVLPIVLYLHVGMEGVGVDAFEFQFGPLCVIRFQYLYVGLPALDAVEYEERDVLASALLGLMRIPAERAARMRADAARRIAVSEYNEYKQFLLMDCLEAYLTLSDSEQQAEYDRLITTEEYEEVKTMAVTTYERGLEQGLEQGRRGMIAIQIETKFGPLETHSREQLEAMNSDELDQLARRILTAESMEELGFGNGSE